MAQDPSPATLDSLAAGLKPLSKNDLSRALAAMPAPFSTGVLKALQPTTSPVDQEKATIANLPGYEVMAPDAGTISSLASSLKGLNQKDLSTVLGAIPSGSPLAGDITKVWQGSTPQAAAAGTSSGGIAPDQLAQAFGSIYQNTMIPFLKAEQAQAAPVENSLIAGLKQSMAGASPQVRAAIGTLPEQLQAEQGLMNEATLNQVATAPYFGELLNQLSQATTGEKAMQQALQIMPYYSQATQGIMPSIPGISTTGLFNPTTVTK